jgi:hypothetical protein
MNPSKLLRRFLDTGTKPSSQREASSLLDESRSILASQLQTTSQHIQNFTDGDIDQILAGGKTGVMARAHAIYNEKQGRFVKTGNPLAKPTAKAPAPKPSAAASKPAPVIHRAKPTSTASKPSTPAPSAPSANITAKDFIKPDQSMTLAEFNKMKPAEKMRFVKSGGKIV